MAERIAMAAAKVAVETTLNEAFAALGIARGNLDAINELRADLAFIRSVRQGSVKAGARFALTLVTLFAGAVAYGVVDWLRHWAVKP